MAPVINKAHGAFDHIVTQPLNQSRLFAIDQRMRQV